MSFLKEHTIDVVVDLGMSYNCYCKYQ